MWSSISPVEGTLYMGMSNMMYVYQNAGFSQSQQPGQRQNGDGFTTCPLDPRNRLNVSSSVASEEHVWAARSLATMPGSVRPPILPHSHHLLRLSLSIRGVGRARASSRSSTAP